MAVADTPDPLLLVMPSDHYIRDNAAFIAAVREGASTAREGMLVSFGIEPTTPHTGYGYIHEDAAWIGIGFSWTPTWATIEVVAEVPDGYR